MNEKDPRQNERRLAQNKKIWVAILAVVVITTAAAGSTYIKPQPVSTGFPPSTSPPPTLSPSLTTPSHPTTEPAPTATMEKYTINQKGSDTLLLLAQRWAEAYMDLHPEAQIAVSGGGSGTGIAA
ncbi:MAG: hypothetical protein QXK96_04300, partial [Candidatus Bathyarchaeia archaeon]